MEKSKVNAILSTVGIFLLYEILALVSFGLSNSFEVYSFVAIPVLVILIIAHFAQVKKDGFSNLIIFLFPFILLGIVVAFGSYSSGYSSVLVRVLVPFAFISFAALGYLSSYKNGFKISTAIMLIYGGLALLVLLSYFATMVQYVPFYTLIHSNSYIYYNGARAEVPIGLTAYLLKGFSFREVSVNSFSLYSSVLFTSVIALLFISPKKETKKFALYAVYAFIGFIALLTMPTRITIITDVLILIGLVVVYLIAKKHLSTKIFARIMLVFAIIFLIFFLILFLNAQTGWGWLNGFRSLIANNSLLNRLFNSNGFVSRYNVILDGCLNIGWWLGFMPSREYSSALHLGFFGHSILFDTILMNGVFGLVILILIIVIAIKSIIKYCKKSEDNIVEKVLIIVFLCGLYGYSLINYDSEPYIFYSDLTPFHLNGLFLISLFLFGYVYHQANKVEKKKESEEKQEEVTDEKTE